MQNAKQLMDLLLAADGEEWFLTVTQEERAEIVAEPKGEVLGKIECLQAEKSSSDDSIITDPEMSSPSSSEQCVLHVSILR